MTMNKIIQGVKEALSFVRGECEHDWKHKREFDGPVSRQVKTCAKCGVRVTEFLRYSG